MTALYNGQQSESVILAGIDLAERQIIIGKLICKDPKIL